MIVVDTLLQGSEGLNLFGEYLKELRKKIGMSQRELGEKVGLDFTYISKIETGKLPPPSEEKLTLMAEIFGIEKNSFILSAGRVPSDFIAIILLDLDAQEHLHERVKVWGKLNLLLK